MTPPSTPQGNPSRQGRGRGNGGRGRSGGRGKGRGRGRGGRNRGGRGNYSHSDANSGQNDNDESHLSDEDVMIAFMKYLRIEQDEDAKAIYLEYGGQQRVFIEKVREFLSKKGGSGGNDDADARTGIQFRSKPDDDGNYTANSGPSQQRAEMEAPTKVQSSLHQDPPKPQSVQDQHEMEQMLANLTVGDDASKGQQTYQTRPSATQSLPSPSVSSMRPPPGMAVGMTRNDYPRTPPSTPLRQPSIVSEPESVHKNNTPGAPPGMPPGLPLTSATPPPTPTPMTPATNSVPATPVTTNAAAPKPAFVWQPRRLTTRLQDQPGRILANNAPATLDGKPHLILRPRKELTATWQLPLDYLRERTLRKLKEAKEKAEADAENGGPPPSPAPTNLTIRDALRSLTVGLFRRGCTENGTSNAIIAKEVVPADIHQKGEFHFEINQQNGTIWGTVPFFTPRTPGNVVLRLYFEDDPIMTLATSRCISVVVSAHDLELTLRFILSNFKSKRGATNFSSIHSLAAVLQQYAPPPHQGGTYQNHRQSQMDGAGRAAWGCICEARKVVDACRDDHLKKKVKLDKQLEELEQLKQELDEKDNAGEERNGKDDPNESSNDTDEAETENEELKEWHEKMNQLMGERASNERKWREIQSAFASVLKSAITNPESLTLLKPDIVKKMQLEYYLWCPLCENFASNPYEEVHGDGSRVMKYPYPIVRKHFALCTASRSQMQEEALGFAVKTGALGPSVYQEENGVCSKLTKAMEKLYDAEYGASSSDILRKKALVRQLTENAVSQCDGFPQGTRVVVFGSSANGFGSPKSDLDMCLQLSENTTLDGEEGAAAMGLLAEKLMEAGMLGVDSARLTARIPVIKFDCRVELDGSESIIECDISMQNPLACINTALLQSYSTITPTVRILAAIVKRWAKRRNINDPSHHTLSSYGYIIMLLHFLSTHKASVGGGIESIFSGNGPQCPLLPNLQWMDQRWLQSPPGSQYAEWQQKPANQRTMMKHPTEDSYLVNTHFLRINDQAVHTALTRQMEQSSEEAPPVGYLLAAFFRYYAFDFDYKKHIVSLNAISRSGLTEREAKAESDGWKLYGQSLGIEDPFEEFYDVAHVLKPINFQRTIREFALAYSKIMSSMSNSGWDKVDAEELLDSICQEITDEE